jgi:hypothetical protein
MSCGMTLHMLAGTSAIWLQAAGNLSRPTTDSGTDLKLTERAALQCTAGVIASLAQHLNPGQLSVLGSTEGLVGCLVDMAVNAAELLSK